MSTWFGRDRWIFCSRLGGWLLLGYARAFDHPILARFRLNDVPIGWFVALPLCIPYLQWIWYRVRTKPIELPLNLYSSNLARPPVNIRQRAGAQDLNVSAHDTVFHPLDAIPGDSRTLRCDQRQAILWHEWYHLAH